MTPDADGTWTPLAALADVTRQSRRFVVEGVALAVWRGPWGRPIVFVDRCPHKDYPLSNGKRTLRGRLTCDAHGWTFDAAGECVAIPGRPVSDARGRHAEVVPSRIEGGQLWVSSDALARLRRD